MAKAKVDKISRMRTELAVAEITENPEFNQAITKSINDLLTKQGHKVDDKEEIVVTVNAYLRKIGSDTVAKAAEAKGVSEMTRQSRAA